MPLSTDDLIEVLLVLSKDANLRVTVSESIRGGILAGSLTVAGGVLGGPIGLAVGGAVGGVIAAATGNTCKPVSQILAEMDSHQRQELERHFRAIFENLDVYDVATAVMLLSGNVTLSKQAISTLTNYITNEMKFKLVANVIGSWKSLRKKYNRHKSDDKKVKHGSADNFKRWSCVNIMQWLDPFLQKRKALFNTTVGNVPHPPAMKRPAPTPLHAQYDAMSPVIASDMDEDVKKTSEELDDSLPVSAFTRLPPTSSEDQPDDFHQRKKRKVDDFQETFTKGMNSKTRYMDRCASKSLDKEDEIDDSLGRTIALSLRAMKSAQQRVDMRAELQQVVIKHQQLQIYDLQLR